MDSPKTGKITSREVITDSEVNTETLIEVAQSSVELTVNAKGQVQFSVKVYSNTPHQALIEAQEVFDRLAAIYKVPLPNIDAAPDK